MRRGEGEGSRKLRSFCNALMRLTKSQCLVGSRNRTTLENGRVSRRSTQKSGKWLWRIGGQVTVHRPTFARRQGPSRGFTLGS